MIKQYKKEDLKNIITEITAGMVLFPKDERDKAWNDASARAIRIVKLYQKGEGLFQYESEIIMDMRFPHWPNLLTIY